MCQFGRPPYGDIHRLGEKLAVEIARGGYYGSRRRKEFPVEGEQRVAVYRLDLRAAARYGFRRRIVWPETGEEGVKGALLNVILDLHDFGKDDLLFLLVEFLGGKGGGKGNFSDQFHGEAPFIGWHTTVDADAIALGESVGVASGAFYLPPEGKGVVPLCALEEHVLDEMNEAPRSGGFVPGPKGETRSRMQNWENPAGARRAEPFRPAGRLVVSSEAWDQRL